MGNPRADDKKEGKPEEKKDFLGPMQEHIASIIKSAGTDNKRDAYLGVLKTKLGAVAADALDKVTDEKKGSLGKGKLEALTKLSDRDAATQSLEEKQLDAKFAQVQDALLNGEVKPGGAPGAPVVREGNGAKNRLDKMKADAKTEIEKLFNVPADFKKEEYDKVFKTAIDDFKKDIQKQRAEIRRETAAIVAGIAPPGDVEKREEVEARSKEQLAALDAMEKHFVKEVENQRDTAIYEAMATTKFKDAPFAPGVAAVARGTFLNPGQDLTLEEHAQRLRVTPLLDQIKRITKEGVIWDEEEEAEFKRKGFIPGLYRTHIYIDKNGNVVSEDDPDFPNAMNVSKQFEITQTGIKLYESWRGWSSENVAANCNLMLEVFSAMTGKEKGVLSIEKNVNLSAVQAFARAVLERKAAGKEGPTLTLSDESVTHLLKQTRLGVKLNTPEEIAKTCVELSGLRVGDPGYDDALRTQLERVKALDDGIKKEAKEGPKQQNQGAQHPGVRGMKR